MSRLLRLACLLSLFAMSGCAFNRTDFVTGPDGKPQGELSDSAKTVKSYFPPRLRFNF